MTSLKTAKSILGNIYQFNVNTANEFKKELNILTTIPISFIKILSEDEEYKEDEDFIMDKNIINFIFIEVNPILLEWIKIEKLNSIFL